MKKPRVNDGYGHHEFKKSTVYEQLCAKKRHSHSGYWAYDKHVNATCHHMMLITGSLKDKGVNSNPNILQFFSQDLIGLLLIKSF